MEIQFQLFLGLLNLVVVVIFVRKLFIISSKMAKIVRVFKVLRNNWKKTAVAVTVLGYGVDYGETALTQRSLVKKYCREAVKYGDARLDIMKSPRRVVVLLNPAANKKKAQKEFEKYCAPLLHLAGICVTVLTTNKNVDAIDMTNRIPADADAVLIAGGDGMVSEVITGLLRLKNDQNSESVLPIGILPVGRTNTLANKLYSFDADIEDRLFRIYVMMEATFSIIRELTKTLNVMEVKNIDDAELKPMYAINRLQFGAYRDAQAKKDKYWYFGPLRTQASFLLGFFNRDSPVKASIKYTPPCSGCSKCYFSRRDLTKKREEVQNKRWWHPFVPSFRRNLDASGQSVVDYAKIVNPRCGQENEIIISTVDLNVSPEVIDDVAQLRVDIGPEKVGAVDFIREGWQRAREKIENVERDVDHKKFYAQELHFTPLDEKMNDNFFSMDNEDFEIKKISVSLLHNVISVFQYPKNVFSLKS